MTPFVFGKIAEFENFTNREDETELLQKLFKALNNVIVISPRRWGKSSLIKHATNQLLGIDSEYRVIYIDMFNIRTEEEFYQEFASKTLKVGYSKVEDLLVKSKTLFQNLALIQ
jgi:AAA+ ATPase superfamily predicted ATPase